MARSGTPGADDALVIQLASGATHAEAAKACGLSLRTVQRRLEDADFCGRVAAARKGFTTRALDRLLSLRLKHIDHLDRLGEPASKKRRKVAPPNVQLGAAKAIVELGCRLRVEVEFDERLRALEDRVAAQQAGGAA